MAQPSDSRDLIEITQEKINYDALTQFATVPEAGAVSSFIGTTRNNFNGKKVECTNTKFLHKRS
jgi:molybdopterin synthase catalytic subunit